MEEARLETRHLGIIRALGWERTRGDLAFDGEDGLIRVLSRRATAEAKTSDGVLRGIDVFFDEIPNNMVRNEDAEVVRSAAAECQR